MDHLPIPENQQPFRAEYRAHKVYGYDQKGFLGFPKRKDVDQKALVDDGRHQLDDNCLRVFVQSWLFWGLLSEFMLPPGKVDFEQFLEADEMGTRITTKNLMPFLAVWRDHLKSKTNPTYFMRLNLVINTAKAAKRALSARAAGSTSASPIQHSESLAIAALGETLQWALVEAQKSKHLNFPGWSIDDERGWGLGLYDRGKLAFHGICLYDMIFLEGLLKGSVCGLYYADSLKSFDPEQARGSHKDCDAQHCAADTMLGPYKTRHAPDCDGSCPFLEPNHQGILETVLDGGVPVLSYTDYPPSLSVRRHGHGLPYVVISHVWADGLGNPEGNAMLACQMKRLATLVEKFSDFQGQSVGFWIDSICVPVESTPARRKAISQMSEIYAGAFATIVLSADLMDFEAGHTGYLEPAMRITTSKWMRRLWTFQEGVMSRNLYFLFADGLRNTEDLEVLYPHAASESVLATPARSFYTSLLRPRTLDRKVDAAMVSSVYRAVQWRTTSHADDECLALARVLNIGDPRLLDRSEKAKMGVLLQNLPEIPAGLMFMAGPRLTQSPFRWAPATWMMGSEPGHPDPLTVTKQSQLPSAYSITTAQSALTDRGLLVRYAGYRLHCSRHPIAKRGAETFRARFPVDLSLRHWYRVQAMNLSNETVGRLLPEDESSKELSGLAVICCRPNPGTEPEVAVLVFITGETQGTIHCRWLDLVKINLFTEDAVISKLQQLFTTTDRFWYWYFGETMGADQLWTVD